MPNAANIDAIKRTVKATNWMVFKGDIGDPAHQQGTGDHTTRSTHIGKLGYPTQGVVHAIDTGMTNADLDLVETFIRRSWRRGELTGIKYFNVLNRHWNTQSWTNYNAAKAGTLQPRYSGDHHLHLSMENGSIDGDLLERFKRWKANGQSFNPPPEEEDDEMGAGDWPGAIYIPRLADGGQISGPINPVRRGIANPRDAWMNFGFDTFDKTAYLRMWWTEGQTGRWQPFPNPTVHDPKDRQNLGIFHFPNGIGKSFPMPAGAWLITVGRAQNPHDPNEPIFDGNVWFGFELSPIVR